MPNDTISPIKISINLGNDNIFSEILKLYQTYFIDFWDFNVHETYPAHHPNPCKRPDFLTVFTAVRDDILFLKKWCKHYSEITDPCNIYVIDHGSEIDIRNHVEPGINILRIPRGLTDHINLVRYCCWFQRFLLTQYNWVVKVDVDEFLVHRGGWDRFLDRLRRNEHFRTIRAGNAADILQTSDCESELDIGRPITLQRSRLNMDDNFRKPVISRIPTSWMIGFHECMEIADTGLDPDLWLIHIRFADVSLAAQRYAMVWRAANETCKQITPGYWSNKDDIKTRIQRECQDSPLDMPDWMRGTF